MKDRNGKELKVGDKVRAVDLDLRGCPRDFTEGNIYTIKEEGGAGLPRVEVDSREKLETLLPEECEKVEEEYSYNGYKFQEGDEAIGGFAGDRYLILEKKRGQLGAFRKHDHKLGGLVSNTILLPVDKVDVDSMIEEDKEIMQDLSKSELEKLVEKANEWEQAKRELYQKYSGKFERNVFSPGASSGFETPDGNYYIGAEYRVKPKPKFEPFEVEVVGPIYEKTRVALINNNILVGCKRFDKDHFQSALIKLCKGGYGFDRQTALKATRHGLTKEDSDYFLPWHEADRILEALEEAGY